MAGKTGGGFSVLKQTGKEFIEDKCPRLAAAVAYYTLFALPPMLLVLITILGTIFGQEAARGEIQSAVSQYTSERMGETVQSMLENVNDPTTRSGWATILGIAGVLFGATGAFVHLQEALNAAWGVEPEKSGSAVKSFLLKRALSFAMLLGIGLLLIVLLVATAALSAFSEHLRNAADFPGLPYILGAVNLLVSLVVAALLFGAIFKILPDAKVAWKSVWPGALFTAVLFVIGKFLIGLYLGHSSMSSSYGAAGSLAMLLVWVYYSLMILLLGAEFTQVWARHKGQPVEPDDGSVRTPGSQKHPAPREI